MRYRIEDCVVDTDRASGCLELGSRAAGYGQVTKTLYRSRRGRWYMVHQHSWTENDHDLDYAEWLSPEEAARCLSQIGHDDYRGWPEIEEVIDNVTE